MTKLGALPYYPIFDVKFWIEYGLEGRKNEQSQQDIFVSKFKDSINLNLT